MILRPVQFSCQVFGNNIAWVGNGYNDSVKAGMLNDLNKRLTFFHRVGKHIQAGLPRLSGFTNGHYKNIAVSQSIPIHGLTGHMMRHIAYRVPKVHSFPFSLTMVGIEEYDIVRQSLHSNLQCHMGAYISCAKYANLSWFNTHPYHSIPFKYIHYSQSVCFR